MAFNTVVPLRPTSPFGGGSLVSGPRPVAPTFGLNTLPRQNSFGSGSVATGLPSPSVGTLLPVSRSAPVLSHNLPFATPSVGVSFGGVSHVAPSTPRPVSPTQNFIGVRE
jgi:hypothetical protein